MQDVIIDVVVQVLTALLVAAIGVLGTWVSTKIGQNLQLKNISLAVSELETAAKTTVSELQQTIVDGLKAASTDGKLTQDEITSLGETALEKVTERMSTAAYNLLTAAGVDISSYISGAVEAWVQKLKTGQDTTEGVPAIAVVGFDTSTGEEAEISTEEADE